MKTVKSETELIYKVRRTAHILAEKALIISHPDSAKVFLSKTRKDVSETRITYKRLLDQVKNLRHLTHEVENLLDNYYIIDSAISDILDSPIEKGFRRLVQIEKTPTVYIPRIYSILKNLLDISGYNINRDILQSFLESYQTKAYLSIRELGFVPLILKVLLIEKINSVMQRSIISLGEYKDAEYWFEQIVKKGEKTKGDYSKITSSLTAKYGIIPINLSFHLLQKLTQYGPDTRPIVKWLKLNLLKQGINISDLGEIEDKRQNDLSLLISHIIDSLRWINQARWDDFVVESNIIDSFLKKDPAQFYARLDSASQNTYRNEIVKIGDRTGVYESEIAKQALRLCHPASPQVVDNPENHIGYYLLGSGRDLLDEEINFAKSWFEKIRTWILNNASRFYLGSIILINILLTLILLSFLPLYPSFFLPTVILVILFFILNLDITINLVNIFVSRFIPVRSLFRLDLSKGVDTSQCTFVVIPSMLRDNKSATELLTRLEVNYLGNTDSNVYFALLMGFRDSAQEVEPTDQALVYQMQAGIDYLNNKYPSAIKRFYFFHRKRVWNPLEGAFIEWERKRGKLREFNLFIRGAKNTSFVEEFPNDLPRIKYVLTIDEDTRLPKNSAIQLIGCIDHPLNRPIVDKVARKVISGYGIIQPRMTARFSNAKLTHFSRLFSSAIGIDSYSGPVADVYQDLFNNSIFYGKGIYDVDAMEIVIGDRIPENQVLSHDLLEGLYTRVGFATDIFLFEGFPRSYKEYILRMHRWIRGDWQIIGWLGSKYSEISDFKFNDKWKIFDNLRRSLLPVFCLLFMVVYYVSISDHFGFALGYILLIVGSSFIISYLFRLFQWPKEMSVFMKINTLLDDFDSLIIQMMSRLIFLLDQAIVAIRAIFASVYRMLISHHKMLEWQNSHEVSQNLKGTIREFIYIMLPAVLVSLFGLILAFTQNSGLYVYIILGLWLVSPFVAYRLSLSPKTYVYTDRDKKLLRNIACRSARFFLEFSTHEGNYLMPDHHQEEPVTNSPASTSPTNIGMNLLAYTSAYDLGYISLSELFDRLSHSFSSLNKLERFRGHFYNWYDIRTLQSLNPKYVSSVDSANLLLTLLTLRQSIQDIIGRPIINNQTIQGFSDIVAVLIEDANFIQKSRQVSKQEKRLARNILIQANAVLLDLTKNKYHGSASNLTKIFSRLAENNLRLKKIITNLNFSSNQGNLASIYSSINHFNILLEQQTAVLSNFMPYYSIIGTKPAVRNLKQMAPLATALGELVVILDTIPTLEYLDSGLKKEIEKLHLEYLIHNSDLDQTEKEGLERWCHNLMNEVSVAEQRANLELIKINEVVRLVNVFFTEADFSFLYNIERGLFHIGYNVTFDKIDNSYYDFLASEANSISVVSIMKNQVPLKHWFYLGRKLVRLDSKNVLLSSWGGSLFEYLTSLIFFRVHSDSLLGHSAGLAIDSQIKYSNKYSVPWGMGESAFSVLDINSNYQYQIFGHPALGFKRDLADFLVVAPYTTIMALAFRPQAAMANIKRLIKSNLLGRYGFYDSVDYTPSRNAGQVNSGSIAKIYYAHHQGFSLITLNNEINSERIRNLFSRDPLVQSIDTLFEEKLPSVIPVRPIRNLEHLPVEYFVSQHESVETKQFIPVFTPYPRRILISNGSYYINMSNSGGSGSRCGDINLTRFREDPVTEPWGQFIYIHDLTNDNIWSPTTAPIGVLGVKNKIEYSENKARFSKVFNEIESSLLVSVASTSNIEFRSLTLTNQGKSERSMEIINYGEVDLSKNNDDLHHSAFEKLFVKSEYLAKYNALIFSKKNKEKNGINMYFAHKLFITNGKIPATHTTARDQFIGRGGSIYQPQILATDQRKAKSILGYNFDQIFSFQQRITLKPNETVTINYINIFTDSRDELIKNLKRYSTQRDIDQSVKISDKNSNDITRHLGVSHNQASLYQSLASRLLAPHYPGRNSPVDILSVEPVVQTLWRLGVSGDLPVLLLRFYDMNDLAVVKNILSAHRYLKYKGISHDLILLNEYPASYIKSFEDEVDFLIRYNQDSVNKGVRGGVFHLRTSYIVPNDRERLLSLARVVFDSKDGTIEQQINILQQAGLPNQEKVFKPSKKIAASAKDIYPVIDALPFYNGLGGFDTKSNEYTLNINYEKKQYPLVPWANVVANNKIGFVVTESGASFTWLTDSYDNRLTRRIDDSLTDRGSETLYLRDEETGEIWNPTPLPIKGPYTFNIKHGHGYTEFSHKSHGLNHVLNLSVAKDKPVKIINLKLFNTAKSIKKLSLTGFFEVSFGGANWEDNHNYINYTLDQETKGIIIRNTYRESFKNLQAFIDFNGGDCLISNDRQEFLGKGGSIITPAGLKREKISNKISLGVDQDLSMQTFFEIAPGTEKEIILILGGAESLEEIRALIRHYRSSQALLDTRLAVRNFWSGITNNIQIQTPDESLNILFNSQLLYQLVSSRLLGRTGYYQPSGAYGFRDQLQDSLALVWSSREMTREMILRAANHQFVEGDVENWWHEHNDFGVRTVFSDQQLWLPYALSIYLETTGDPKILSEQCSYRKATLLDFANNSTWAGVPETLADKYDLYDHAIRAIEKTFNFGKNGLPLIGKGDWNDGLNKVGEQGYGESVWLGWFLCHVINKFLPYIKERGDFERVKRYEQTVVNLKYSLERNAWDGKWYKRAYFDNGNPLGSRKNKEFKIDSISQSWAIISEAGRIDRTKIAMESLTKYLWSADNLNVLISPPLSTEAFDPGYIKNYPPGVRENGAQYNHAALWTAQAFALLKDSVSVMKIIDSINPIKRSLTKEKSDLYRVEPYVVASDIYAKPAEAGRGGWTWYTGSAGVMYRTIFEYILGLKIRGDKLEVNPCIPKEWPRFSVKYTYQSSIYNITAINSATAFSDFPSAKFDNSQTKNSSINQKITVDGIVLPNKTIHLLDDGKTHEVEIKL